MTRFARALAFAAWTAGLTLPVVAPAASGSAVMAEVCTAGGVREVPVGHRDAGESHQCRCCTSGGAAAVRAPASIGLSPAGPRGETRRPEVEVRAAIVTPLPPGRGPPA